MLLGHQQQGGEVQGSQPCVLKDGVPQVALKVFPFQIPALLECMCLVFGDTPQVAPPVAAGSVSIA